MRGLAFPTDPAYHREYSNGRETPVSNVEDIPIDPALAGPIIDPAILAQEDAWNNVKLNGPQHQPTQQQCQQPSISQYHMQYSPGPQGDPFAPQPPPIYFPDSTNVPTPKPMKRKRKPRREEECGFCQGDDSKNKDGQQEVMVTCVECGRSGHPTCMDLGEVADVVRSYPWSCIECKKCEICREKGDDERILFCDLCDRGWHMDCLQPPLNESPPGKWHCPMCPPLEFQFMPPDALEKDTAHSHFRESSVASTSYSREIPFPAPNKRKGKSKVMFTDDSEVDSPASKRSGRSRNSKGKDKARMSDTDQEEAPISGARPIKRMKLKVTTPPPPRVVVRLRLPPSRNRGKEREEEDEPQKAVFEDILAAEDRDTTRTTIEAGDKSRYEKSRAVAEVKLFPSTPTLPPHPEPDLPTPGPSSRPLRSSHLHNPSIQIPSTPGPSGSPAPSTPCPGKTFQSSTTPALRIRIIRFGEFDIQTWYDAPFPEEYANLPDGRLWLCEFCLKYMRSQFLSMRHRTKCKMRHPPGDEIYRDGAVSVFEVDGRKNKIYCQNLCLLSKMFLDHKSLFYDVEPFLFYVITETDDIGARFVGYFSKEKRSPKDYNLSCIMTLPVRQRKGWGNLLIDFSYLLSKKEQRVGSPEKPLSALGTLGYRNYWTLALMRYLDTAPGNIRLEDISASTCMTMEDTCVTLTQQGMLIKRDTTPTIPLARPSPGQSIKFTRGRKNGVARRHLQRKQTNDEDRSDSPFVLPTDYEIKWDKEAVRAYLDKWEAKGYLKLKPERLKWSPFILFRTRKTEPFVHPAAGANGDPQVVEGSSLDGLSTSSPNMEVNIDTSSAKFVHENSAFMPSKSEASISPTSDARSKELLQVEQDRALALRLANPKPSPITRLRNQDNLLHDIPETHQPNGRSRSPRTHRSRSQSSKAPTTPVEPASSFEDDQALAAKLASEESRSRRQLRSRSNTSGAQELKRTSSTLSSKAQTPARKRRRIESSPELDSPITNLIELDKESGNANGDGVVHNGVSVWPDSELIHGGIGPEQAKENGVNGLNGQIPPTMLDAVPHPSDSKEKPVLEISVPNQLEAPKNEVEDLDVGTPLTALTSRMSEFGDENDTPATVEEVLKGEERDFPVFHADDMVDEDAEGDEDEDEDAEGEPDEEVDYT